MSDAPSLRLPKRKNISASHHRAPKQEKEAARRLGGRLTAGSGNQTEKGDVRVKGKLRLECKTTKHSSFSITLAMAKKIEDAALLSGEAPGFEIELTDPKGKRMKVAVVPSYILDMLALDVERAPGDF
jgi:hypothetical protein